MNNVNIYISHDVTGCLIFGKEFELFLDYTVKNEKDKDFWVDKEDIMLSKGASEAKKPLPIVSSLAKVFMKLYHQNPEAFEEENNPDELIIPVILKRTMEELKLHPGHLTESQWVSPTQITDEDYLFRNNIEREKKTFPLIFEIIMLIGQTFLRLKSDSEGRALNSEILDITSEYTSYLKYLSQMRLPGYLMTQRIKNTSFKPVGIEFNGKDSHCFAVESKSGLLTLAWAELYFASVYEMPFSICSYCGRVYRLTKNLNKSCCGDILCKKSMRKDRDLKNRENDPEIVREKNRLRQQLFRDKKIAKELATKGKTSEEIKSFINSKAKKRGDSSGIRTIDEIKQWIKEVKNK
ncbi:MAG: hypothetical protein Q8934_14435 [Bacillota bacterium]|nr:hypothetical protein [Bacillota bacterium]